jgi:HTH-type transcriptional regulator/antitoxin HigA
MNTKHLGSSFDDFLRDERLLDKAEATAIKRVTAFQTVVTHWPEMAKAVFVPHTEVEYRRLVALLDDLIDEVGEDEDHPLASLMEILGVLIERYEAEHVPELSGQDEV